MESYTYYRRPVLTAPVNFQRKTGGLLKSLLGRYGKGMPAEYIYYAYCFPGSSMLMLFGVVKQHNCLIIVSKEIFGR